MTPPNLDKFAELEARYLQVLERCSLLDRVVQMCVDETCQLRARIDAALAERPDDVALRKAIEHVWR